MRINESMRKRWKRSCKRRKGGDKDGGLAFLASWAKQKLSEPLRQESGGKRIVSVYVCETERERLRITASACVLHVHVRVHLYFASKVT